MLDEEKVFTENYNLIFVVLNKIHLTDKNDSKDCEQEGAIGLLKAIRTYNESKSAFSTYAIHCIKNEILSYLKIKARHSIPLEYKIDNCTLNINDDLIELIELVSTDNYQDELDVNLNFQKFIDSLDERERLIVKLSLCDYSQAEIGKILKIGQPCISRLKNKIWFKYNKYSKSN